MNEGASVSTPPRPNSPAPKCAICLDTCTPDLRCHPDSCQHVFCFFCLLKWAKVNPECPLCKQSFRLIIYNMRSDGEYDKYVVHNNNFFYLSNPEHPGSFPIGAYYTVNVYGERIVDIMAIKHFATDPIYRIPENTLPRRSNDRPVRSTIYFRYFIYFQNMWVQRPVSDQLLDLSPHVYSEGALPVRGSLPDMAADTSSYVTLQQLYQRQAQLQSETVYRRAMQIAQAPGQSPVITETKVNLFCKHSSELYVLRGNCIADEYQNSSPNIAPHLED